MRSQLVGLLAIGALIALPATSLAQSEQPNVVVIMVNNHGWGELGCYGGGILRGAETPRLDRLAEEGLRLLNFNVEPQCTPSRSAFMTGRHPIRSGTDLAHSKRAGPMCLSSDLTAGWSIKSREARSTNKWY